MPSIGNPARLLLLIALLLAACLARAQTPITGANVYLFQPGPISATLLAAPGAPTFNPPGVDDWRINVIHNNQSIPRIASGLFSTGTLGAFGQTSATTPAIPSQGAVPIVFEMHYLPTGDNPNRDILITTGGGSPGATVPVYQTAAVLFGANNTAQIGFAPVGTAVGSFLDFPLRIGVTNVTSLAGGGC